jgi:hypothetical protein
VPSLASVGDGKAVANYYSDRIIFMVEGSGDKNAYERFLGPSYDADLVFRIAPTPKGAGGCQAVRDRVAEEREINKKVYGLLDGEAAALLDGTQELYESDEVLFQLPGREDLIFLNVHEIENLYFAHADVCSAIANHKPVAKLGTFTPASVLATLDANLDRFLDAAYCKYASAYFYTRDQIGTLINTKIFISHSLREIIKILKAFITSDGKLTWQQFKGKAKELQEAGKSLIAARGYDPSQAKTWKLRISDGKGLLLKMRKDNGEVGDAVEGHLLKEICASGYPALFRDRLFALVNYTPSG